MTQFARDRENVPVLVVGGSLVGLATSVFLASYGVEVLTVDRHPGTAIHPRAGHLHLRTLELMRSVGLEDSLQELSAAKYFPNGSINEVYSLAEGEIATYIPDLNGGVEEFSPSRRLFVAQDAIEPLLRSKAIEYGADLVYGSEVVIEGRDDSGVLAVIRELATDKERRVRAQYVVGADGSRSTIRSSLGIEMVGHGELSRSATIYFRADFRHLLGDQQLGVVYVVNDDLRGFFRFEKSGLAGFLVVSSLGDPMVSGNLDTWEALTPERARELVVGALGDESIDVEIDEVALWLASACVTTGYGRERILLVGDAAHVVPPTGGFGGNTGIHDAHNLAWKLAMVVKGQAGGELLGTYEDERLPVGRFTIDQAYARFRHRITPEMIDRSVPDLVDDFTAEIGYCYSSAAVVADGHQSPDGAIGVHPRDAAGRPGSRAAHFWQDADVSSLDLFGQGFVVLAGKEGATWSDAAARVSRRTGIAITFHTANCSAEDFERLYGVGERGASLVRPDGFVCWRRVDGVADPDEALSSAIAGVLARSVEDVAPRRTSATV